MKQTTPALSVSSIPVEAFSPVLKIFHVAHRQKYTYRFFRCFASWPTPQPVGGHPELHRRFTTFATFLDPPTQSPCLIFIRWITDHYGDWFASLNRVCLAPGLRDRFV